MVIIFFFLCYLPSPNIGFTPPGLSTRMFLIQMPVREQHTVDRNTMQIHKGGASLNVWSAQCQGHLRRQHKTENKGHTPSPRTQIKIPHSAGNGTRAAGLEGRDSTDHAKVMDIMVIITINNSSLGWHFRGKTSNRMKHLKMAPWCRNMLWNKTRL